MLFLEDWGVLGFEDLILEGSRLEGEMSDSMGGLCFRMWEVEVIIEEMREEVL